MTLVVYLSRMVRRRWRTHAAIALLLGLAAGISLLSIAGARRTQSSYPRFLREADVSTMSISTFGGYDDHNNAALAGLPQVVRSRTYVGLAISVLVDGQPDFGQEFEASGTFDGRYFDQDRFAVTSGRMADPTRADEVVVNEFAAERFGYHAGQQVQLGTYSFDQFGDPSFFDAPPPPVITTDATITGIGLFPEEVVQDDADRTSRLHTTPAFSAQARDYVSYGLQGLVLRNGDADVPAVQAVVDATTPPGGTETGLTSDYEAAAQRALLPLSIALATFGVVIGLAALGLVGQALSRSIRSTRDERRTLATFGASRASIVASSLPGPLLSIAGGALLAVVVAVAASPTMPLGPVRRVDVDRGIDVDLTVLGFGAAALVIVLTTWVVVVLYRDAVRASRRPRLHVLDASRVVSAAAAAHVSARALTGLRYTLGRDDGVRVVSMRSVMGGAVLAVAAVTASIAFASSLDNVLSEPRLYGWDWDAALLAGNGYDNMDATQTAAILTADEHVDSWSGAYFGADTLDDVDVQLLGMAPDSVVAPPIVQGRMLHEPDEIVLGQGTASDLGRHVGDTVVIGQTGEELRVVGIAILPSIGKAHVAHVSLGSGAIVDPSRVPGLDLDILGDTSDAALGPQAVFVRYTAGTDPTAELARLDQSTAPLAGFAGFDVLPAQRPAEIVHADELGNAPRVLAVGLALAALVSLTLGLFTSVRSRLRDLALLQALGFTRRQLSAAVWWHATVIAVVGTGVGIPLGIVLGRTAWSRFADQMHVVAEPRVSTIALVSIALGTMVIASLVAAWPARSARQVDSAVALRTG